MVKQVLIKAGFVEGKTFKETRFLNPPKTTYAVYMDAFNGRGADNLNLIKDHDYTIELYSYKADPTAELNIETAFNELGLEYDKSERYWIDKEQLYQTIYYFNFIEK